jgi:hypothetical protein
MHTNTRAHSEGKHMSTDARTRNHWLFHSGSWVEKAGLTRRARCSRSCCFTHNT